MHFAFPRYTTTHICTYLRPSISWSPRPRSDECTLVKQVHALVRHGHTCSPKTCTYIRIYVNHARMYVQKQKHAKRHSQHRHNKKDWFKLLTNAFQILLTRKRGSVIQSTTNQPSLCDAFLCISLSETTFALVLQETTQTHKHTYIRTYVHVYRSASVEDS